MINKIKIRILPIFIFLAFLTLTVKINNVFDLYNHPETKNKITIGQTQAQAVDNTSKETQELTKVLNTTPTDRQDKNAQPQNAFTQSEILILQELAERREALDAKSKEIDKRTVQLKIAEEEIDKKLLQLKNYEQKLENLIKQFNQKDQENMTSLIKLYTSMKPKDAARIFNTLDMEITVALLRGMKPSTSSAILSQMDSERARIVTSELIGNNIKKD